MYALLLAAGDGRRLQQVLKGNPKPLLKVGGKSLLEHQLRNLQILGVNSLIVVTKPSFKNQIKRVVTSYPLRCKIIVKNTKNGFESLLLSSKELKGKKFVLLTIDSIYKPGDLKKFRIKLSNNQKAESFLVGVTSLNQDTKPTFVLLDDNEKIVNIGRTYNTSSLITAGIYICPSDFFTYVEQAKKTGINSLSEYLDFYVTHSKHGNLYLFAKTVDVDTPKDINLAEDLLRSRKN